MKSPHSIILLTFLVLFGCRNHDIESKLIGDWTMTSSDSDNSAFTFSFINFDVAYINPSNGQHLNYKLSDDKLLFYLQLNDSTLFEIVYKIDSISRNTLRLKLESSIGSERIALHPVASKALNQVSLNFSRIKQQNRVIFDNIAYYNFSEMWTISDYFVEISDRNVFITHNSALPIPDGSYSSQLTEEQYQTIKRLVTQVKQRDLSFKPEMAVYDAPYSGVYISRNETRVHNLTYSREILPPELQVLYSHLSNLHRFVELIPDSMVTFETPLYNHYNQLKNFPKPPALPY